MIFSLRYLASISVRFIATEVVESKTTVRKILCEILHFFHYKLQRWQSLEANDQTTIIIIVINM